MSILVKKLEGSVVDEPETQIYLEGAWSHRRVEVTHSVTGDSVTWFAGRHGTRKELEEQIALLQKALEVMSNGTEVERL